MKRLGPGLLTLVLATAAVAPLARAADLPVAPAPAAFYRPAIYNWTGFYIGGHVGAGLLQDTYTQIPGAAAFSVGSPINVGPPGAVGGGQVGFNYEFAPWVVGVEGSWTDTGVSGSGTTAITSVPPGFFERATTNTSWIAAATGRVGYAADTLLLYVKGGGAWMKVKYTEDILTGNVTAGTQTLTDTRNGFTAGAGLEYGFVEGWSGKLEYDFYDFGTTNYAFVNTPVSIKSNMHVLTAGLNYRFNWGQ
jgi:outer membrane immunogenic protein